MVRRHVLVLGVLGLVLSGVGAASAQVSYKITDLGTLGGSSSYAYGINALGQVVGNATTCSGATHAFLYSDGAMSDLDPLLGNSGNSVACGINDSGQIVGEAGSHAFVYYGGTMSNLGIAAGFSHSRATAINASGQIAGYSYTPQNAGLPPIYSAAGSMGSGYGGGTANAYGYSNSPVGGAVTEAQAALQGLAATSAATAINNNGDVVGYHSFPAPVILLVNASLAFFYSNGARTDLGTFGGSKSFAFGINNSGQVVGSAFTSDGSEHAYLYNGTMNDLNALPTFDGVFLYSGGTMTNLSALSGGSSGTFSYPYGMNDNSQVVGFGYTTTGVIHAFLCSNGAVADLNTLIDPSSGWTLTFAQAINDSGWIVGSGTNSLGQSHAFLLTPVPEPSAAALALSGLAAVLLAAWRRRKRGR